MPATPSMPVPPVPDPACARWVAREPTDAIDGSGGRIDAYEAEVTLAPGEDPAAAFERLAERLFRYDVFPPRILRPSICTPSGRVEEGATIVQRISIRVGAVETGVRVVRVWRTEAGGSVEAGFSYVTLVGHLEQGVSTFALRRAADGRIVFSIRARSRPASWLARLGRPIARVYQVRATRAALRRFTSVDLGSRPAAAPGPRSDANS